jgi:hypothetical protein
MDWAHKLGKGKIQMNARFDFEKVGGGSSLLKPVYYKFPVFVKNFIE